MDQDVRPNTEVRAGNESPRVVFWTFLDELEDEKDKKNFLNSLSEEEKVNFSSSKEEFRQIFGRDPSIAFPKGKPDFVKDVRFSDIRIERIKERYDEYRKTFPQSKSLDGLKAKINQKPFTTMLKSVDNLRHLTGIIKREG